MDCELLNGLLGGLTVSLVSLLLYFIDRHHKRRTQVNPEKIQLVKRLSVHLETLRRLMYAVNMYLENIDHLDKNLLGVTKNRFIQVLVGITELLREHPFLLEKKYLTAVAELQASIVNMHNFPSNSPAIGSSVEDGRRLQDDVMYQLNLLERHLQSIIGTD